MSKPGKRTRAFPDAPGLPSTWDGRPRGMVPRERELWRRLVDKRGRELDEWWFDVPLHESPRQTARANRRGASLDANMDRMWAHLTARRADAIARSGKLFRVVELRALADAQSLGEVIIYDSLARENWPTLWWGRPLLVTAKLAPNLATGIKSGHIELAVFPDEEAPVRG